VQNVWFSTASINVGLSRKGNALTGKMDRSRNKFGMTCWDYAKSNVMSCLRQFGMTNKKNKK